MQVSNLFTSTRLTHLWANQREVGAIGKIAKHSLIPAHARLIRVYLKKFTEQLIS